MISRAIALLQELLAAERCAPTATSPEQLKNAAVMTADELVNLPLGEIRGNATLTALRRLTQSDCAAA